MCECGEKEKRNCMAKFTQEGGSCLPRKLGQPAKEETWRHKAFRILLAMFIVSTSCTAPAASWWRPTSLHITTRCSISLNITTSHSISSHITTSHSTSPHPSISPNLTPHRHISLPITAHHHPHSTSLQITENHNILFHIMTHLLSITPYHHTSAHTNPYHHTLSTSPYSSSLHITTYDHTSPHITIFLSTSLHTIIPLST